MHILAASKPYFFVLFILFFMTSTGHSKHVMPHYDTKPRLTEQELAKTAQDHNDETLMTDATQKQLTKAYKKNLRAMTSVPSQIMTTLKQPLQGNNGGRFNKYLEGPALNTTPAPVS